MNKWVIVQRKLRGKSSINSSSRLIPCQEKHWSVEPSFGCPCDNTAQRNCVDNSFLSSTILFCVCEREREGKRLCCQNSLSGGTSVHDHSNWIHSLQWIPSISECCCPVYNYPEALIRRWWRWSATDGFIFLIVAHSASARECGKMRSIFNCVLLLILRAGQYRTVSYPRHIHPFIRPPVCALCLII